MPWSPPPWSGDPSPTGRLGSSAVPLVVLRPGATSPHYLWWCGGASCRTYLVFPNLGLYYCMFRGGRAHLMLGRVPARAVLVPPKYLGTSFLGFWPLYGSLSLRSLLVPIPAWTSSTRYPSSVPWIFGCQASSSSHLQTLCHNLEMSTLKSRLMSGSFLEEQSRRYSCKV